MTFDTWKSTESNPPESTDDPISEQAYQSAEAAGLRAIYWTQDAWFDDAKCARLASENAAVAAGWCHDGWQRDGIDPEVDRMAGFGTYGVE